MLHNIRRIFYNCYKGRRICSTVQIIPTQSLPAPAYKPEIVEKSKYAEWEKKELFRASNEDTGPSFSMVLPPPNVTGSLHLGHALACTVQDVILRRKRSMGYNVLWLPGTDHAGIATQGVVEKYLETTKKLSRINIGREKFVDEVWKWKKKHGNTICEQLRQLGCSLDWSREIFTMDSNHANAVNDAFIKLFEKGLIYRKKALVNWCNALKSTVSDIEVENLSIPSPMDIKVPGYNKPIRFGMIYEFAYKVSGLDEEIIVATTLPETMLGDTAVAVNPSDERYNNLKGKSVVHPFSKKTLPIIFDEFVDVTFGTGAVKITPAHSKVDYDIAKAHKLPLVQVINEEGNMQNSGIFDGTKKYDCREKLLNSLAEMKLLRNVKAHNMVLPICSRTGDVIEYLPKEQWFMSCSKLNKEASELVKSGDLKIFPEKFIKNWLDWSGDDRDWCISRQLWWGHLIPAYECTSNESKVWVAAKTENVAKDIAAKQLNVTPNDINCKRDEDVLDTWFSSGIYPFAALGWPKCENLDYQKFYPLDLMATGHDILGFWVHRMVMLGLELTGKLPFNNVLLHGIVCDNKGAKMSKSRGNVIDPIDVINGISYNDLNKKTIDMNDNGILSDQELANALDYHKSNYKNSNGIPECGVDALRFTLLSQDVKSHFVSFDLHQCHANKLFCNKIWQSIKYTELSYAKLKAIDEVTVNDLTVFDKWILSRLANMVKTVNEALDSYDFHIATKALRTLIYNEFCDVYVEATKPGFDSDNPKTPYAHCHTLSAVLNTSLRCLSPFMIYLTDEVIPKIPNFTNNIIHNFEDSQSKYYAFPQTIDVEIWKDDAIEMQVQKIIDLVVLVRKLKGLYSITKKHNPRISIKSIDKDILGSLYTNKNVVLNLARCSEVNIVNGINKNKIFGVLDTKTEVNIEIDNENVEDFILAARENILKRITKAQQSLKALEEKASMKHISHSIRTSDEEKVMKIKQEIEQMQNLIPN